MAKFTDFYSDPQVRTTMEKFISHFPGLFDGFDIDGINVVFTKKKKARKAIRLVPVRYPYDVYIGKPYIVEVFETKWKDMDETRRNLAVFHTMCSIPSGGFDPTSTHYGKKARPDIEMYLVEFAASGGVPNWMENSAACDPLKANASDVKRALGGPDALPPDDGVARVPVTKEGIVAVAAAPKR